MNRNHAGAPRRAEPSRHPCPHDLGNCTQPRPCDSQPRDSLAARSRPVDATSLRRLLSQGPHARTRPSGMANHGKLGRTAAFAQVRARFALSHAWESDPDETRPFGGLRPGQSLFLAFSHRRLSKWGNPSVRRSARPRCRGKTPRSPLLHGANRSARRPNRSARRPNCSARRAEAMPRLAPSSASTPVLARLVWPRDRVLVQWYPRPDAQRPRATWPPVMTRAASCATSCVAADLITSVVSAAVAAVGEYGDNLKSGNI